MLGLTMNRGLADLQPVQRPDWVQNLQSRSSAGTQELARELWANANAGTGSCEVPIFLRALDANDSEFMEYELNMAVVPSGYTKAEIALDRLDWLVMNESPGRMMGIVGRGEDGVCPLAIERPLALSQFIVVENMGRAHVDMVMEVRLASPDVFRLIASIRCDQNEICLETTNGVFSRWIHWYTDWEPTTFPELKSTVGSITTVSKESLDKLQLSKGMEIKPMATVRRTTRSMPYHDYEVDTEVFWV